MLVHVGSVDRHRLAGTVGRSERNLVEHTLHYRLQPPRADILDARIDRDRHVGKGVDRVGSEFELHSLGSHQRDVLLDQRHLGLGQNAHEIVARERQQLHPNR